ncbi:MAG: efflux RND transporter permease subunit [Planctomycetota bacterium]|nr:efflux RND transporter permease subunit [Planctomycetota bacterium]
MARLIGFFLENKPVAVIAAALIIGWGIVVAPFDWEIEWLPRDPVPVDAIPDLGENQQIVFTEWSGRSPQDVEDQITYPLTVSLLGIPGIKTIRSFSHFGFSTIYAIFDDGVEFYWSRTRVLERLSSLPPRTLPEGVTPVLGPDATALGQVFWYTLEGRAPDGVTPTGGWDLHELRTIQDWNVRYALLAAKGVAEVASVGGFVQEYQIDVDPDAMRAAGVTLEEIFSAVRRSNLDVGARTIEINRVEYVIRSLGFIENLGDIEEIAIRVRDNVPIRIRDVAVVNLGPALRRGALDKEGAEAVGGVIVVRFGANPLEAIKAVQRKIDEIAPGLPRRVLPDGTVSAVTIVPFYDRTELIHETLDTLSTALGLEALVTILVVLVMVAHFRASILISGMLPLAVLLTFGGMKTLGVDANVVALSGIAIAIGTIVDMGVVICENILRHLSEADPTEPRRDVIQRASQEVGGAIVTAIATTVVSFLPVFTMTAAEGKLFQPLAATKTLALIASVIIALALIPAFAHILFGGRSRKRPRKRSRRLSRIGNGAAIFAAWIILARAWEPLGPESSALANVVFVGGLIGGVLGLFWLLRYGYEPILRWCLDHKGAFLCLPAALVLWGGTIWLGFDRVFGIVPALLTPTGADIRVTGFWSSASRAFPGLGKEFMPPLDEGAFLYMPSTMPHASIGEAMDVLAKQDMAIRSIPEIKSVVGKIGRAESPLDPAPISMMETIITYLPEYGKDDSGRRVRQWRPEIRSPRDIWEEIERRAQVPGSTSAPPLQPIQTRLLMLQSGMRAPMGVKVKGPDLQTIEKVGFEIERLLKEVPSVEPSYVIADRIVGKPYIEIDIDRKAIARYGIQIQQVQQVIEVALGGKRITTTVEGRERYPVRVRYQRELRDSIEELGRILVAASDGAQIPLEQVTETRYVRGPQSIKSEDTLLVGYVTFDKRPGFAEVDVVEECRAYLADKIESGDLVIPDGVSYTFAGTYENQVRAERRLMVILPLALSLIVLILYLQFRSMITTLFIFSGIFVAWAGGFQMLWLYSQPWFLDVSFFGSNLREVFQVAPINLSVAVWVGFLALFGIATDDGVILSTYLDQTFARDKPRTPAEIRDSVVRAGKKRIRPCLMTSATTILALLPVLSSTGKGSDVMVPMAIPSFGGMTVVLITIFVVPTLYCLVEEWKLARRDAITVS